ncbi:MAG: lipopolysaccharide biosynthesis protein [Proteobacteria bacterium]|nr:lipopolysaccharide biosynthesis protein [Pseudomonadota bacterium]
MSQNQENAAIVDKILSGARWATVLKLVAQLISWVSTIIVVRFISPGDYGLNAMLEAPLELMLLFSTLGLDFALVRSKQLAHDELRSAFGWLLLINGILFLAYFFGGALIAAYFNEPRLELLSRALAFIFLLLPFRVIPNAILNRDLKFKLKSFAELIASITSVVTTLVLAVQGAGVWALVAGMLTNRIVLVVLLMIMQPWFIMPSFSFSAVRGMIAFGGMTTLWGALVLVGEKLPSLIGGPVIGVASLGIFAVAMQFALLPISKVMPVINQIIFPAFSKFQQQRTVAGHYFGRSLGVISLGLFPVMIGNACIAQEFVSAILGEKWSSAIVPLVLLSTVMPFRLITSLLRPVISSMDGVNLALISTLTTLGVLLPLMIIGVHYGVTGMVLAVLVTEPIVTYVTIRMSKSVLDISFTKIGISLRPAAISSVVMVICTLGIKFALGQSGTVGLIIEIAAGAASYYLMLRIFFADSLKDAIRLFFGKRAG